MDEPVVTSDSRRVPPEFCQYADDPCDQTFKDASASTALVLYPSQPTTIASTIEAAKDILHRTRRGETWLSWRDLNVTGRIIFCRICEAMRLSETVVADVTTLNFNLLFEIGYALGLEMPVVPVRDTTYTRDKRVFDDLGLLDTIGYTDFQNSEQLATALASTLP